MMAMSPPNRSRQGTAGDSRSRAIDDPTVRAELTDLRPGLPEVMDAVRRCYLTHCERFMDLATLYSAAHHRFEQTAGRQPCAARTDPHMAPVKTRASLADIRLRKYSSSEKLIRRSSVTNRDYAIAGSQVYVQIARGFIPLPAELERSRGG